MCIVDLTVYRHNSLNSEGGACFQVTISRHVRRTRRGEFRRVSIAKNDARTTPRPIRGGSKGGFARALIATENAPRRRARPRPRGRAGFWSPSRRCVSPQVSSRSGCSAPRGLPAERRGAARGKEIRTNDERRSERSVSRSARTDGGRDRPRSRFRSTDSVDGPGAKPEMHSVPQPRFSVDYTPVVRHSDEESLRNRSSPCTAAPEPKVPRATRETKNEYAQTAKGTPLCKHRGMPSETLVRNSSHSSPRAFVSRSSSEKRESGREDDRARPAKNPKRRGRERRRGRRPQLVMRRGLVVSRAVKLAFRLTTIG